MNMRRMLSGLCIAALCSACSNPSSHDTSQADSAAQINSTTMSVDVWVVTRSDGTGNDLWDMQYARDMLEQASRDAGFAVQFQLRHLTALASTDDYELNQDPLLSQLRMLRRRGVVTVLVSNPGTTDFAGLAATNYTQSPILVMRARVQEASGLDEAAQIFLHELGHNMGLTHESGPFHTDDYSLREDGRQYLVAYALFLSGN